MKFKVFLFSMITTICLPAFAVNIGGFDVNRQFCEQSQKLAPILNTYSNVQFPVVGFPGISAGLVQNTSVLLDFCNYIMQVEQLGTQDAIFFTGNYLNTLTDRKWDDSLRLTRDTWSLANQAYDFENGTNRKGTMQSAAFHRQLSQQMVEADRYSSKNLGTPRQILTRGERQQQLNQLARVAHKRAIYKDALACTAPSKTNFSEVYRKEVETPQKQKDEAVDEIAYIREKLLQMGSRFANDTTQLQEYINEIDNLIKNGVGYRINNRDKKETTTKNDGVDEAGVELKKTRSVITKTQVWSEVVFANVFNDFRQKWSPRWNMWVKNQYLSNSRGLLLDPASRVEKEFVDLYHECSRVRLRRGIDINRPDYMEVLDQRLKQCKETTVANQKKSENLMVYYVDILRQQIQLEKAANAKIWTAESFYLGINRNATNNEADGFQQEDIQCADNNKSPAVMAQLNLQQQQVEAEYSEIIAQNFVLQNAAVEDRKNKDKELMLELQRREDYVRRQTREREAQLEQGIDLLPFEGGM